MGHRGQERPALINLVVLVLSRSTTTSDLSAFRGKLFDRYQSHITFDMAPVPSMLIVLLDTSTTGSVVALRPAKQT